MEARIAGTQARVDDYATAASIRLAFRGFSVKPSFLSDAKLAELKDRSGLRLVEVNAIDELIGARAGLKADKVSLDEVLRNQGKQWTEETRNFLRQKDRPDVRVEFSDPGDGDYGVYFNARAQIAPQFGIQKDKHAEAISIGIHEITHHDQAFLMAARFADQLSVGIQPTALETQQVFNSLGIKMTRSNVDRFLIHRAGRRLSSTAEGQADSAIESFKALNAIPDLTDIKRYTDFYDMLEKNPIKTNMRRLYGHKGESMATMLGVDSKATTDAEYIYKRYAQVQGTLDGQWSRPFTKSIENLFEEDLARGRSVMQARKQTYDQTYFSSYHEKQARRSEDIAKEHLRQIAAASNF